MSLLKFPSLLSNPSWMKISSTLNVCSRCASVSFKAFFPRVTVKRRVLMWELKDKFITCCHSCFSAPAGLAESDLVSYPSGKQWVAVRTQQGEIKLPPQRKIRSLDLLRQNMAAIHGWDSTVAIVPPTIFICFLVRWPHVDSAGEHNQHDFYYRDQKAFKCNMMISRKKWPYLTLPQWVGAKEGPELKIRDCLFLFFIQW